MPRAVRNGNQTRAATILILLTILFWRQRGFMKRYRENGKRRGRAFANTSFCCLCLLSTRTHGYRRVHRAPWRERRHRAAAGGETGTSGTRRRVSAATFRDVAAKAAACGAPLPAASLNGDGAAGGGRRAARRCYLPARFRRYQHHILRKRDVPTRSRHAVAGAGAVGRHRTATRLASLPHLRYTALTYSISRFDGYICCGYGRAARGGLFMLFRWRNLLAGRRGEMV